MEYPEAERKLAGIAATRFAVPADVVLDTGCGSMLVAVFVYASMRRGLDSVVEVSPSSVLGWMGWACTPRRRDRVEDAVSWLGEAGYLTDVSYDVGASGRWMSFSSERVSEECSSYRFGMLYGDEVVSVIGSDFESVPVDRLLHVLSYLKLVVPKRPNALSRGDTVEGRRARLPEAWCGYMSEVAGDAGVDRRCVSRCVDALCSLGILKVGKMPSVPADDGTARSGASLFCMSEKREGGYVLASGPSYWEREIAAERVLASSLRSGKESMRR